MADRRWVWLLALGLLVGCSYYYGKGGIVDQAVLEDIADNSHHAGRSSCDTKEVEAACPGANAKSCQTECDSFIKKRLQK